jgi:hypothetical protein
MQKIAIFMANTFVAVQVLNKMPLSACLSKKHPKDQIDRVLGENIT